ncbi:outer membrane protein assembly factor BamB family protein [Baekduia sp. Peel2402]|uniref:outer membrane protein assembly factor BamB family protein n=1 Tax=Baekduia sp. Peel2402 TaxID=3458296 RepID=UPI00403E4D15
MRIRFVVALFAAIALAVAAVTGASADKRKGHGGERHGGDRHGGAPRASLADRLDLPAGWQPEGIAAARGRDLYVGSIPTGAVLKLDPRSGKTTPVVAGQQGRAAIGLKYDNKRDRLVVAGGPTGKAFIYDARSGTDVAQLQLAQPGAETFVNDIALTRSTAYFTDSRRSAIYAVDLRSGEARTIEVPNVPLEDGNNLNGIVAAPDDTLLAVQSNAGRLWKIDPKNGDAQQVDLGGTALTNGDGLLLGDGAGHGDGRTLYVVQNRLNQIAVVRLAEDLASGAVVTTIKSTGFDVPSTIAALRGELYAVNARFGTTDPAPAPYWVTLVRR